jgi:hypothetical protein
MRSPEEVGIELTRQTLASIPKADDHEFDRALLQAAEALILAGTLLAEANRRANGRDGEGLRLAERVGQRVRLYFAPRTDPQ